MERFSLGLIINPYSGIGGALAFKGSDGIEIREKALAAGAEQQSLLKAKLALNELLSVRDNITIYTASGDMGENIAKELGFNCEVVYQSQDAQTESSDTELAAKVLLERQIDLLLFAGGDGTARNVCRAIGEQIPVVGVPAGVKIHSGVYAITPQAAGKVVQQVIEGKLVSLMDAEVRDIDEEQFRMGKVLAKHYGEMQVPQELNYIQAVKMGGKESEDLVLADIAAYVQELMDDFPEHYFVMGSGSTVDFVMKDMGLENTLLGVDIVFEGEVIASDVTASQLIEITRDKPTKLVMTIIGGQGHILGRGNQQLSPEFMTRLDKSDIWLVATKTKLNALGQKGLIVDTPDIELNASLAGPMSVLTGYRDKSLYFVRSM